MSAKSLVVQDSSIFGCKYEQELAEDFSKGGPSRDEYYFETDHEALRGNTDYLDVLKTLVVLQAQKVQAVKDLEVLIEAKNEALKDPLALIEKLQGGQDLGIQGKQDVAKLPCINWSKYGLASITQSTGYSIRKQRSLQQDEEGVQPLLTWHHSEHGPLEEVKGLGCKVERTTEGQYLVRGRLYDGKRKPKTFNQPWTPEEQQRLEELLIEFPSEEVEMDRWKKIASRLGNRTPIQVQSRIQKYFLKLHKAGLPIPGRLGKRAQQGNRRSQSKLGVTNNRGAVSSFVNNRQMYANSLIGQRHSSFFPHLKPEVIMPEDEERDAEQDESKAADGSGFWHADDPFQREAHNNGMDNDYVVEMEDVSDEEGITPEMRDTNDYKELMWLKRIRREKELEQRDNASAKPVVHLGYRCDGCGKDPIVGPRFTCIDCSGMGDSFDICTDCAAQSAFQPLPDNGRHTSEHAFRPVRKKDKPAEGQDRDYIVWDTKAGSYLDPNYQYFK